MKKLGIVLAGTVLVAACGQQDGGEDAAKVEIKTDDQKASYALGYRSAEQMSAMEGLDTEAMIAGIRDGHTGTDSRLGDEDLNQLIQDFQMRLVEKRQAKLEQEAEDNLKKGEEFLAENSKRDGVTTTDSGLQYEVLKSGEEGAPSPTVEDTVTVHYEGSTTDGEVFDSSIERDQPATFGLAHIIPGWQEALPMMKVGDKWKLYLPAELGYGKQGAGGDIGPNEVLIFEVELLGIQGQGDDAADDQAAEESAADDAE